MKKLVKNSGVEVIRDENTKEPIGIKYVYYDDPKHPFTPTKIEKVFPDCLTDEWFVEAIKSIREENNEDRKYRRHVATSLDGAEYEGDWFADEEEIPANEYLNIQEEEEKVLAFANTLSEINKRRFLIKYENPSLSYQDIADLEHTSKVAIFKSFKSIKEQFLKFSANLG